MNKNITLALGLVATSVSGGDTPYAAIKAEGRTPAEQQTPYRAIVEDSKGRSHLSTPYSAIAYERLIESFAKKEACDRLMISIEDLAAYLPIKVTLPSVRDISIDELLSSDVGESLDESDITSGKFIELTFSSRYLPGRTHKITFIDLDGDREIANHAPLTEWIAVTLPRSARKTRKQGYQAAAEVYKGWRRCMD